MIKSDAWIRKSMFEYENPDAYSRIIGNGPKFRDKGQVRQGQLRPSSGLEKLS